MEETETRNGIVPGVSKQFFPEISTAVGLNVRIKYLDFWAYSSSSIAYPISIDLMTKPIWQIPDCPDQEQTAGKENLKNFYCDPQKDINFTL